MKMLGVPYLRSHWGPLSSIYNNLQTMPYGACYMGGLALLNTQMQLALKLFITKKFNKLSKVIFYSKKILISSLIKLWKQSIHVSFKGPLGSNSWKRNFKILNNQGTILVFSKGSSRCTRPEGICSVNLILTYHTNIFIWSSTYNYITTRLHNCRNCYSDTKKILL